MDCIPAIIIVANQWLPEGIWLQIWHRWPLVHHNMGKTGHTRAFLTDADLSASVVVLPVPIPGLASPHLRQAETTTTSIHRIQHLHHLRVDFCLRATQILPTVLLYKVKSLCSSPSIIPKVLLSRPSLHLRLPLELCPRD